jgi:PAS domain S-box-containing protein
LRAILDSAVDGILSIDEVGTIESLNPAASALFGYEARELVGTNVKCLMPPPYSEEHDGYLAAYRETGDRKIIGLGREVTGLRKDGTEFPLALAVSEGHAHGRRIFTGIVRDLTEREALRQTERRAVEAEKLASIATLTAGIAHDIGTPMNVILGYAGMLENSLEDAKQRKRARLIGEATQWVADLIQTLLNVSRPHEPSRAALDLSDVLTHSLDFFREKLKKRGIRTECRFEDVAPVAGDRDQLEQVFLNLFVNAADAMAEGGMLTVGLSQDVPGEVVISVRDTGTGIDPEDQERIFEPFYTTKEPGKGNGLGLLVSRRIISEHGGTVQLHSELGKGTEFEIRLPTRPSD